MMLNFNVLSTLTLVGLHFIRGARGHEGHEASRLASSIPATEAAGRSEPRLRAGACSSSPERQNLRPQEPGLVHMQTMKASWIHNKDQMITREKDTHELKRLMASLRENPNDLLRLQERGESLHVEPGQPGLDVLFKAIDGLESLFEALNDLNTRKVLELGGHDHLPHSNAELVTLASSELSTGKSYRRFPDEINTAIAKKAWPHLGLGIMAALEELIIDHQLLSTSSLYGEQDCPFLSTVLLWWKCIFKYVDFMTSHEQLDQGAIRSWGPDTMKHVVQYAKHRFEYDIGRPLDTGSPYLTTHWYWPLLLGSFKALSQDQERFINAYVLLDLRHNQILTRMTDSDHPYLGYQRCKGFFECFDSQWYLKLLERKKNRAVTPLSGEEQEILIEDIGRIIEVLTDPDRNNLPLTGPMFDLMVHLFYLADFINRHLWPGVMGSRVVANHRNFDEFVAYFEYHRADIQLNSLLMDAKSYKDHFKTGALPAITASVYTAQLDRWKVDLTRLSAQLDRKIQAWNQHQRQFFKDFDTQIAYFHLKVLRIAGKLHAWSQ